MFVVVVMGYLEEMARTLFSDRQLEKEAGALREEVRQAIEKEGRKRYNSIKRFPPFIYIGKCGSLNQCILRKEWSIRWNIWEKFRFRK